MFGFLRHRQRFPAESVVLMLATFATETALTKGMLAKLAKDATEALGHPDAIERRLLDLWVVNETLVRSSKTLTANKLQFLIDGFHREAYALFSREGLSDRDLGKLQHRILHRYEEYGDLLNRLFQSDEIALWSCPESGGKEKWRILPVGEVHD